MASKGGYQAQPYTDEEWAKLSKHGKEIAQLTEAGWKQRWDGVTFKIRKYYGIKMEGEK